MHSCFKQFETQLQISSQIPNSIPSLRSLRIKQPAQSCFLSLFFPAMSTVLNKTQATPPTGKVSPQLLEAEAWQQGQEQHIILLKKLGGDTCKRLTFTHEHGQDDITLWLLMNKAKVIFDKKTKFDKYNITFATQSGVVLFAPGHPNPEWITLRKLLFDCRHEIDNGELILTVILHEREPI